MADQKKGIVTLNGKCTLLTFTFRPLLNGDKLRYVFETSWDRLPEDVLPKLKRLTGKIGELSFTEDEDQPGEGKRDTGPGPLFEQTNGKPPKKPAEKTAAKKPPKKPGKGDEIK